MYVKDCLGQQFIHDCQQLAQAIVPSYAPDLVVGICTGGAMVAKQLLASGVLRANYAELTAQRPSTHYKKKIRLDLLLCWLPKWLCNLLRIIEVKRNVMAFDPLRVTQRHVVLADEDKIMICMAKRLLVIDDAVDSGATLRTVCEFLQHINPNAELRTAVLTVTFPAPLQQPDFSLYRNVLLRFPWSADVRGI